MSTNQETRGFQSEVKQLLQLMIHSLYSNKEIFLRELISNASDAADKLRFKALSNPALYEGDGDLRVRVSFDADKGTITISDNGIGMTREQVIDHLGTIAKSGTKEFLTALGKQDLVKLLELKDWSLILVMKTTYIDLLRLYYFVGGMPEAVKVFIETQNVDEVRQVQRNLLMAYEQDFSKHIHDGQTVQKVRSIWASIPEQLAKENKKFIYAQLQKGARSKDYEIALQWLKDSGLVHSVPRVKKPHLPLSAYQDNAFKLYGLDVGLLAAQSNLDASVLLEGSRIFTEFKGALTEQYVLQQLIATQENPVFYWATEKGTAEVDFVVQRKQAVIPIEVKAEENLKAKSLKVYVEQFQPEQAIRFSMADYREQDWLVNVPLYNIEFIIKEN